MLRYDKKLKNFSQQLRKNMTDAERLLWSKVRGKQVGGYQFYRQKTIGSYIVDFYCPRARLVIELDGGQHYTDPGKKKDIQRDKNLKELGLEVLRFSDREIFEHIDSVMEVICGHL